MTEGFSALSPSTRALVNVPVKPGEDVSAAAIIHDNAGNILLQLREDLPKVAFGGYWGLFGGRVEAGETPLIGLARELQEELSWNGGGIGDVVRTRHYFLVPINPLRLSEFELGEGADIAIAAAAEVPHTYNVMPHDHLALSMFWGSAYSSP